MEYTKETRSLVLKPKWWRTFLALSDERAGKLVKALFAHARGIEKIGQVQYLSDDKELKNIASSMIEELDLFGNRDTDRIETPEGPLTRID